MAPKCESLEEHVDNEDLYSSVGKISGPEFCPTG